MLQNKLRINTDKTEFIIFGRAPSIFKLPDLSLDVGENRIKPSDFVKNLGIYMDKELNYHRQIISVAKICFYHLRNIRRIRSFLTEKTSKKSRLEHNNSLLLGVPKFLTNKIILCCSSCLQRI